MSKRIVVVSELFFPEECSTGYFLTEIAKGFAAAGREVLVICAQPSYHQRGIKAPRAEKWCGLDIRRIRSFVFNPRRLLGKVANALSISFGLFFKALFTIRTGDAVLIVTNPPLAPKLVQWVARWKGARFCLLVHDVYPDVFVPLGLMKESSFLYRVLDRLNAGLYKKCHHIIVLGRDMQNLVLRKLGTKQVPVTILPNWGDVDEIVPKPGGESGLREALNFAPEEFVVLYSGNHGKTHNLMEWVEVVSLLQDRNIRFLFVGEGSGKKAMVEEATRRGLKNVTFHGFVDRGALSDSLSSGDLGVISFSPGMEGISVPSRLYNLLAAGRPVLAICGVKSELAQVIVEDEAGWVIEPGQPQKTAQLILEIAEMSGERSRRGENAREVAVAKYSRNSVIARYNELFAKL